MTFSSDALDRLKEFHALDTHDRLVGCASLVCVDDRADLEARDRMIRGDIHLEGPLNMKVKKGGRLLDFVHNDLLIPIVSSGVIKVFEKAGFSGWRHFPVAIEDKDGKRKKDAYSWLAVTGRAGPLAECAAEKWKELPDGTRVPRRLKGFHFDVETWDGSSLFLLKGRTNVLAIESVIDALKSGGLRGWRATSVLESPY